MSGCTTKERGVGGKRSAAAKGMASGGKAIQLHGDSNARVLPASRGDAIAHGDIQYSKRCLENQKIKFWMNAAIFDSS